MMRRFECEDIDAINSWLKDYELSELTLNDLPAIGVIEDDIAVGFLCKTDSDTCFLEGFISNAKADAEKRSKAILKISKYLLGVAETSGFKKCLVMSNKLSLIERSIDLGFEEKKITVLVKNF